VPGRNVEARKGMLRAVKADKGFRAAVRAWFAEDKTGAAAGTAATLLAFPAGCEASPAAFPVDVVRLEEQRRDRGTGKHGGHAQVVPSVHSKTGRPLAIARGSSERIGGHKRRYHFITEETVGAPALLRLLV
jgi:hypothetical protein